MAHILAHVVPRKANRLFYMGDLGQYIRFPEQVVSDADLIKVMRDAILDAGYHVQVDYTIHPINGEVMHLVSGKPANALRAIADQEFAEYGATELEAFRKALSVVFEDELP